MASLAFLAHVCRADAAGLVLGKRTVAVKHAAVFNSVQFSSSELLSRAKQRGRHAGRQVDESMIKSRLTPHLGDSDSKTRKTHDALALQQASTILVGLARPHLFLGRR